MVEREARYHRCRVRTSQARREGCRTLRDPCRGRCSSRSQSGGRSLRSHHRLPSKSPPGTSDLLAPRIFAQGEGTSRLARSREVPPLRGSADIGTRPPSADALGYRGAAAPRLTSPFLLRLSRSELAIPAGAMGGQVESRKCRLIAPFAEFVLSRTPEAFRRVAGG